MPSVANNRSTKQKLLTPPTALCSRKMCKQMANMTSSSSTFCYHHPPPAKLFGRTEVATTKKRWLRPIRCIVCLLFFAADANSANWAKPSQTSWSSPQPTTAKKRLSFGIIGRFLVQWSEESKRIKQVWWLYEVPTRLLWCGVYCIAAASASFIPASPFVVNRQSHRV